MEFAGAASNQLVLYANNDKFPVMINQAKIAAWMLDTGMPADGMMDVTHCVMTHQTHLNLLADIFDFHKSIESIGDLLMEWSREYGIFMYVIWATLMLKRLWDDKGEKA